MPASDANPLFTVGHSNHECEKLLDLLAHHRISAVADVRSQPYSQYTPQFNREALERVLRDAGILTNREFEDKRVMVSRLAQGQTVGPY